MILTIMLAGGLIGACTLPWQQSSSSRNSGGGTATATPVSPTDTPQLPTATPTPAPPTLQFNGAADTDMDGLHIHLNGLVCPSQIVLKHQQYTYDAAALQQIKNYISAFARVTNYGGQTSGYPEFAFAYTPQMAAQLPPIPDTLLLVPGSNPCVGRLEFTNTGTQSVQITSIGVTFDADAIQNTLVYQPVEICTVLAQRPGYCNPRAPSGGPLCYIAKVNLQGGPAGTQVNTPIASDEDACTLPLTLDSGQPTVQSVSLFVNSALPQELYRVRLTVTVTGGSGTQVLRLPSSFTNTLAFSNANYGPCYELNGNTFVQEPSKPYGYCVFV